MYDKKINQIFKYISELKQTMSFENKLLLLANMARDVIDADRCSIWSYDHQEEELISKVAHGVETLHLAVADGIVGHSFLTKKTIILDDVYKDKHFDPSIDEDTGYRTKSTITMPILNNKGEAIGVFQALNKKTGSEIFTEEDKNLLDFIITFVAEVLESTILYSELQKKKSELEDINKNLETLVEKRTAQLNKEKIKAQNANKAKSEFLANMSHEIRTPLNAILGFISILQEEEQNPKKVEFLQTINQNSKTLLNTINDILDFSKIENGEIEIERVSFDIREEINSVINLFETKIKEKNLQLHLSINNDVPQLITSDPHRLKQIIANLISNSTKFTAENKNIYISIIYKNDSLQVEVKDEGIGIEQNKLDTIFDPFSQADSSTTRKFGGTGLGLAICKKLINLLGGDIEVYTKVGVGSNFSFNVSAPKAIDVNKKDENYISLEDKKIHILLVEDNKSNQMFMKILLKKLNFTFEIANDGVEAVEKFKQSKYDMILMDENMPNMNGIEATSIILDIEREKKLKHTPIIAITANALKGDRERFLSAGMDEYLTKPLERNKFIEAVSKLLKDYNG